MQNRTINKIRSFLIYTVPVLTSFAALVCAAWGRERAARAEELERLADEYAGRSVDSCSRCAMELSESVNEMSISLSKLRVTASAEGKVLALEDIVRESAEAAAHLSRLPQSQVEVMELSAFLTRAGDYARSLSRKLLSGGEPDKTDIEQLGRMLDSCDRLNEELSQRIAEGSMPAGTEDFDYYAPAEGNDGDASEDEPSEPEYPTLLYDGPFSESVEKREPLGLSGHEEDEEAAVKRARMLFGPGLKLEERSFGNIEAYEFSDETGRIGLSLTVKGLHVLRYMRAPSGNREGLPGAAEYEKLVNSARGFLEKLGFTGMEPTYEQYYGGTALFSFVWKNSGALVYNDMVKVWIDRETLEPTGLDAQNYLFSHRKRRIPIPSITGAEARKSVFPELSVSACRLALIPLTPMTETLCYEFTGTYSGREYIVYVNVETGREEQIFELISDDNGRSAV